MSAKIKKNNKKNKKKKRHHYDRHVSCPSYPVCDDAPLGCLVIQGIKNVEWYGHKGWVVKKLSFQST